MNKHNSGNPDGKSRLNAQDRKLWQAYVRDVTPLDPDREDKDLNRPDEGGDEQRGAETKPDLTRKTKAAPTIPPRNEEQRVRHPVSHAPQLDRRTDDRLRRGKLPIEARLDLHGMSRDSARHALAQFLREAHAGGKRCVLVITGKGALGAGSGYDSRDIPEPGVLRRSVPEWLAMPPLSDIVLRHYPARAKDGGDGAIYILLRRN